MGNKCLNCGDVFELNAVIKAYCSKSCANKHYYERKKNSTSSDISCIECSETFTPTKTGQKFCSASCSRKNWRKNNTTPESRRDDALRYRYGINSSEWDSMNEKQNFACAICGAEDVELVVDHNHGNGEVRGLLCSFCNSGLGYFRDNMNNLINAASYLMQNTNVLENEYYG